MNDQRITARETQRVIKFRAWDGKTMFYPSQITFGECGWHVEKGRGVSIPYQPHVILMQFTGLLDKHKNEIYEHDIMALKDASGKTKYLYVVKFEDAKFVLHHLNNDYGVWGNLHRAFEYDFRDYEFCVVGNIYTTPELVDPKMIER